MMNKKQEMTTHSSFQKLEQRLILLAWLNGHFGYENNRDLLAQDGTGTVFSKPG